MEGTLFLRQTTILNASSTSTANINALHRLGLKMLAGVGRVVDVAKPQTNAGQVGVGSTDVVNRTESVGPVVVSAGSTFKRRKATDTLVGAVITNQLLGDIALHIGLASTGTPSCSAKGSRLAGSGNTDQMIGAASSLTKDTLL